MLKNPSIKFLKTLLKSGGFLANLKAATRNFIFTVLKPIFTYRNIFMLSRKKCCQSTIDEKYLTVDNVKNFTLWGNGKWNLVLKPIVFQFPPHFLRHCMLGT